MKIPTLALILTGSAAPLLAETTVIPSASSPAYLPVPTQVVHPVALEPGFVNERVFLRFRLDRDGIPHDVAPASRMPSELAVRLVAAVSQWHFTPCRDDQGNPVERNVVLPLDLADHH